ncbi:superantigen-like protein SSL4 [Hamadaea tsunoensis]|uniref:hypothetical protein n=1 Tax=Hamadaea tsunoensis TaxID=53368 RepID=UPI0004278DBA|nr:hypothetical protein [Hamadaea tsunoensis]
MTLTGTPFILTAFAVAAAATGLLAWAWRRLRGRLMPVRVLGILVCEALLLVAVAAEVNQAGDFYPSWAALEGSSTTAQLPRAPAVHLSRWLAGQAAAGSRDGLVFTWHTAGLPDWRLAGPPVVYLPPESFQDPSLAVPVVVVVQPPGAPTPTDALHRLGVPACVVFLRTTRDVKVSAVSAGLPEQLTGDLPVLGHGWAVVGVGSAMPVAVDLLRADTLRFQPLALLPSPGAAVDPTLLRTARVDAGTETHTAVDLTDALIWAAQHTPAALAPPLTLTPLPMPSTTVPPGPHPTSSRTQPSSTPPASKSPSPQSKPPRNTWHPTV